MTYDNSSIEFQPKPTRKDFRDIEGMVFEFLTVKGYIGQSANHKAMWLCECRCGKVKPIQAASLLRSDTHSCGYLSNKRISRSRTTHSLSRTKIFSVWIGMIQRCNYLGDKSFVRYGGRGIKVCERWLHSVENFYADMGDPPTPAHTLDRKDVNGDYTPGNCKWSTPSEQGNNRRNNCLLTFQGKTQTMTLWARELHINPITLQSRLAKWKWSVEKALTAPLRHNRKCCTNLANCPVHSKIRLG